MTQPEAPEIVTVSKNLLELRQKRKDWGKSAPEKKTLNRFVLALLVIAGLLAGAVVGLVVVVGSGLIGPLC